MSHLRSYKHTTSVSVVLIQSYNKCFSGTHTIIQQASVSVVLDDVLVMTRFSVVVGCMYVCVCVVVVPPTETSV